MHSGALDMHFLPVFNFCDSVQQLNTVSNPRKKHAFKKPVSITFLSENKSECGLTGMESCIEMQSIHGLLG